MNTTIFPYSLERKTNVKKQELDKIANQKLIDSVEEFFVEKDKQRIFIDECIQKLEYFYSIDQNPDILKAKRKMMSGKLVTQIKDTLGEACIHTIVQYNEQIQKTMEMEEYYKKLYQETLDDNRFRIQMFIKDNEYILKTLPLINKDFDCKLKKYLATDVNEHTAKIRKLDHQIIRLMTRATMKTSPFSFLTSVCLYDNENQEKNKQEETLSSECEINNYILKATYDMIVQMPFFAKQITYRLNANKEYEDGYLFLYQKDYEKGKVYKTVDGTIKCKKNYLLSYLRTEYENKEFSFDAVVDYLMQRGLDKEKAEEYVYNNLILKNVITPASSIDETKENIYQDFIEKVSCLKDDEQQVLKRTMDLVLEYEKCVKEFQQAKWEKRFEIVNRMDAIIAEIEKIIEKEFVHNILVYEDSFYQKPDKPITKEIMKNFDFSKLQFFFQLFDQSILMYELFSENFYRMYGDKKVNASDLEIYHMFVQTSSHLENVWKDNFSEITFESGEKIKRITRLKKEVLAYLNEKKAGNEAYNIRGFIDQLIEENKDLFSQEIDSATLFLQMSDDGNAILNKVYKGQLVFFSRFLKIFDKNEDKIKAYGKKAYGPNPMEITESFGFNANVHERLFDKRLVLDLTDQNDSSDEDIKISDCYFYYDPEKKLVKLGHDDYGEISAVFLGSLAYNLMPIPLRTINGMQPTTRFDTTFLNYWNVEEKTKLVADHMPRVNYDNIVLIRDQYLLNSIYDLKKDRVELYGEIIKDFKENGLPTRFFMRPYLNSGEFDFYGMGRTSLKPQFIDLSSPLLFQELLRELENNSQFIIEEVYPDNKEDSYIYEYEVERTVNL